MTASDDAKSPEMVLIHDSCQDARARVALFHVAFGTYQKGEILDAPKAQNITDADYLESLFDLRWQL